MKIALRLFVVMMFAVLALAPSAFADGLPNPYYGYEKVVVAGATWVAPDYINLSGFPPLGGKVSTRDARILNLHLEPLQEAGWFVNELRERHTFEVVWLDKGEMVWVGNGGHEPRYRASCGNRISPLLAHQITQLAPTPTPPPAPRLTPAERFWNSFHVHQIWKDLGWGLLRALTWPFIGIN